MKKSALAALVSAAVIFASAYQYSAERQEPVPVLYGPDAETSSAELTVERERKRQDPAPWLLAGVLLACGFAAERTVRMLDER